MDLLGLLGAGRASRADRPHGLVSNDGLGERVHAGRVDDGSDLTLDDRARLAGLALLEGFANTDDRRQARRLRGLELGCHDGVRLAVEGPTLRMTDDDVTTADVSQHLPGDFAREGARPRLVGEVLRSEKDRTALQPALDGRQIDVR